MEWNRPLPNVDADIAPFWEGLRRHEFLLFRCRQCESWYWPAAYCRKCPPEPFFGNMTWEASSGRGRVFAFNIHRRASHAGFKNAVPYVFALIELNEGPMFGTNVVGCAPEEVRIGMPLKVRYEDVAPGGAAEFTLAMFEPA